MLRNPISSSFQNFSFVQFSASEFSESSEASVEDQANDENTSYSADVSQTSDVEELRLDKTLQDVQHKSDFHDPRDGNEKLITPAIS